MEAAGGSSFQWDDGHPGVSGAPSSASAAFPPASLPILQLPSPSPPLLLRLDFCSTLHTALSLPLSLALFSLSLSLSLPLPVSMSVLPVCLYFLVCPPVCLSVSISPSVSVSLWATVLPHLCALMPFFSLLLCPLPQPLGLCLLWSVLGFPVSLALSISIQTDLYGHVWLSNETPSEKCLLEKFITVCSVCSPL